MMRGYKRGLIRSTISVASLGISVVISVMLVAYAKDMWGWLHDSIGARAALLAGITISNTLLSFVLNRVMIIFSVLPPLGWLGAMLGATLGIIGWGVIFGNMLLIAEKLGATAFIDDSRIGEMLRQITLEGLQWLELDFT